MLPVISCLYLLIIQKEKLFSRLTLTIYIGWLLVGCGWLYMRFSALNSTQNLDIPDMMRIVLYNSPALVQFAGKMLLPFNLSVYPIIEDTGFVYGCISVIIITLMLFFSKQKRMRAVIFGFSWFFFFSILSFIKTSDILEPDFVEHRTYLPSIGFLMLLLETDFFKTLSGRKVLFPAVAITIIGLFAYLNYEHNKNYRNECAYWKNAVETSPHSSVAHRGMGVYYSRQKQFEKAIEHYLISIKMNSKVTMSHNNIAAIYIEQQRYEEAKKELEIELKVDPWSSPGYFNMGVAEGMLGNMHEAGNMWYTAVMYDPRNADANNNLGVFYFNHHEIDSAEKYIYRAAELDIRFVDGLRQFANYFFVQKNRNKLMFYVEALQRNKQKVDMKYLEYLNASK